MAAGGFAARDSAVVFRATATAARPGFRVRRIWQTAGGFRRTFEADGFARAHFAFAIARKTDAQHRAVEKLE